MEDRVVDQILKEIFGPSASNFAVTNWEGDHGKPTLILSRADGLAALKFIFYKVEIPHPNEHAEYLE